jgi:hypothetical protein
MTVCTSQCTSLCVHHSIHKTDAPASTAILAQSASSRRPALLWKCFVSCCLLCCCECSSCSGSSNWSCSSCNWCCCSSNWRCCWHCCWCSNSSSSSSSGCYVASGEYLTAVASNTSGTSCCYRTYSAQYAVNMYIQLSVSTRLESSMRPLYLAAVS